MLLNKTGRSLLLASVFALSTTWAGGEGPRAEAASHNHNGDPSVHMAHLMSLGPADESFDLRFLDAMILHHEGAVLMAEEALQKSRRQEIRQLAEAILRPKAKKSSKCGLGG